MAKEKTIEELIKNTLVLKADIPYDVPDNWLFFKFIKLIDYKGGTQPPKSKFSSEKKDNYIRLLQIRDYSTDEYKVFVPFSNKLSIANEDDILVGRYGASVGKICRGLKGAYNVALVKLIFSDKIFDKEYVYWMLKSTVFQVPLNKISRTAQSGFNKNDLSKIKVPFPPLSEQKRIAKKLNMMFDKISKAQELIEEAREIFEDRKAALHYKAFSGELTKKWRKEKSGKCFLPNENETDNREENKKWYKFLPNTWEIKKLKDIIEEGPRNGLYKPKSYYGDGVKIVRIDNFYEGKINPWETLKELSVTENELEKFKIKNGEILLNRVNSIEYLGKSALVRNLEEPCVFESNIMRIRLKERIDNEYAISYLNSPYGLSELRKNAKHAVNQASINQTDVKSCLIPLPPLEEQKEITRIIKNILEKELMTIEILKKVDYMLDDLKKSILTKAFRGELGTNNSDDEDVIELLKKVLSKKVK